MKIVSLKRWSSVLAFVGLALVVGVGCGGDDDDTTPPGDVLGECPQGADTTAGQNIVATRCATAGCHAPTISNPSAPDLTTEAAVTEHAVHMYQEAEEGAMPPGSALPSADLESLRVYLACLAQ